MYKKYEFTVKDKAVGMICSFLRMRAKKGVGKVEEISKKELLNETGISYGQLYRWKREGLIPEEWFVKRSAYTGQETFFPRDRVLARVQAILAMKDAHSLDEIRESLANGASIYNIREALLSLSDMGEDFVDSLEMPGKIAELSIESLAMVVGLYQMALRAKVDNDRVRTLIDDALSAAADSAHKPTIVSLVKSEDSWHFITASLATWIAVDKGIVFADTVQVADITEHIRTKMSGS